MHNWSVYKNDITNLGFTIIENIFSENDVNEIISLIENADASKINFRKSTDLFAIRQFLKEIPKVKNVIFNDKLKEVIHRLFGEKYFIVKSIYFDKPESSNWYVSYHQDLTISVDHKIDADDFKFWTLKQKQFSVQPPLQILKNIYTVRIHLDDTDIHNGALRVIENSHSKEIFRPEFIDWKVEKERVCNVKKGGIMIMKPLILHSSNRTTNDKRRRVIHIEFSDAELPYNLNWAEKQYL